MRVSSQKGTFAMWRLAVRQNHARRFAVLNDFEANGYGVPTLTHDDLLVLHDVPPVDKVCYLQPGYLLLAI